MVAGYVDGIFGPEHKLYGEPGWDAAGWARFPNAVKWQIAVSPSTNYGNVLDVETGDATPAQAPGWVRMRRAAGVDPIVYMNASTWPAVRSQFQLQGVPEPHYWVAQYDNNPAIPAGAIAKQYANPTYTGHHYDLSNVAPAGAGSGTVSEDDSLLYIGPTHPLAATLKAFAAGSYYPAPFTSVSAGGGVTAEAVYAVDGYCYSSTPVHSDNLGNGQPGPDSLWWHVKTGGWVPDAILVTVGALANAPGPNWPAGEPVAALFDSATGRTIPLAGSAAPDDDSPYALKTHVHQNPATQTGPAQ